MPNFNAVQILSKKLMLLFHWFCFTFTACLLFSLHSWLLYFYFKSVLTFSSSWSRLKARLCWVVSQDWLVFETIKLSEIGSDFSWEIDQWRQKVLQLRQGPVLYRHQQRRLRRRRQSLHQVSAGWSPVNFATFFLLDISRCSVIN